MNRAFTRVLVLKAMVLAAASSAQAQVAPPAGGPQPAPPPLTNLQIYPKDIARPELIATMQGFVQQLGAPGGCGYCHVGTPPQYDFASDANPKKNVARRMILMSREITAKLPDVTGKAAADVSRLRCATCHRGAPVPKLLADVLTETSGKSGVQAAVQQYRDQRQQAGAFTDSSLVAFANSLTNAGKPDDALAFLRASAELSPNYALTYAAMAQAYGRKNDRENQIKNLEKAVQLDPNNPMLKGQLNQLKTSK